MHFMDASSKNSVLIIDDHPVYREALTERLANDFLPEGIAVLGACNANEGLDLLGRSAQHWVVLLDILMPGLSGLAGIKVFKNLPQVAHVVAISGLDEQAWEPRSVAAGATLFLSKNNTSEHIIAKIRPLLETENVLTFSATTPEAKEFRLTQRQLEVLHLISLGHPNKVIADLLEIKEQTIKIHINQIFKELRVFNRTQAVLKAQKYNLLSGGQMALND
jgi:DNA-binding NarL/FixJ family response regulator